MMNQTYPVLSRRAGHADLAPHANSAWLRCFAIIPVLCLCSALAQTPKTVEQTAPITSACEFDYPPFCIVHEDGSTDGFSVELLAAALKAMGRDVTFRTGPWAEVKGWLERGEVQVLPLVGRTPERENVFDFTFPYVTMHGAIVVREDATAVHSLGGLAGRRVAVMKADNAEEFLRRTPHSFDIITTPTFTDALQLVAKGECDATVVQRLVALRLLRETGIKGLRIVDRPVEGFRQDFCFAVRKGDRDTLALLNEGLALVVADGTFRRLHAKWFAFSELPSDRPIVVGGDEDYPPFEFLDDNGQPAGYNVDLVRAAAEAAGVRITIRLGPWADVVQELADGSIDAIEGMFYSAERSRVFDFSQPYIVNHCVAVIRAGEGPAPETLADLAGRRLVVQNGDIMHNLLLEKGIKAQITAVETQQEALRQLAAGRHDCALVARMTAFYEIEKGDWHNLVVGRTPLLSPEYCFAVRKGRKALLAQLSEGLVAIEHNGEYRRIYQKWMGVYEERPPWRALLKIASLVVGPLLLIALAALFWSWSLRRQVLARTRELAVLSHRHAAMLEAIPDIVMEVNERKIYTWSNPAGIEFFGADVLGKEAKHYFVGEQDTYARVKPLFDGEQSTYYVESRQRRRDGEARLLAWWCRVLKDPDGRVTGALSTARDITEQRRASEEVARVANEWQTTFDSSNDAIWILDRDQRVLRANKATESLLGWTGSDVVGKQCWEVVHGTSQPIPECPLRRASESLRREIMDMQIGDRWLRVTVDPIQDADGRFAGAVHVISDVTESRHAEEEIRRLSHLYATLSRANAAMVHCSSTEELLAAVCLTLVETGKFRAAWIGMKAAGRGRTDVVASHTSDPDLAPALPEQAEACGVAAEALRTGRPCLCNDAQRDERTNACHAAGLTQAGIRSCAAFPVRVDGSEVGGVLCLCSDVRGFFNPEETRLLAEVAGNTGYALEHFEQQARLVASETQHKALVEQIPAVTYTAALDATSTTLFVSPQVEAVLGVTPDAYRDDPDYWLKHLHADDRDRVLAEVARTHEIGESFVSEYRMIAADGHEVWVRDEACVVRDCAGAPLCLQGTMFDITERKQAEAERARLQTQLAQTRKMESVGRLAGGVAHDFNNLLMGIMNYVELCRDALSPDHAIREWLDEITSDAQRSANLTRQLLAFARKQVIAPKVLDLNDTVESMLKLLRRLIGEDIDLAWVPGASLWPVKLDPGQVDQVLANLCVNARDAIGGVGKVTIETENVVLDEAYCSKHAEAVSGNYVLLAVSDDGRGMDRETVERIFEPFFTTKGVGEGTGLGLATVYGIVKQNNGFVNVYSEPGKGSAFKVYLPRIEGDVHTGDKAAGPGELPRGTETILLAEDEKSVRVTARLFLEGLGYTVLAAETPEAALRFADEHAGEIQLLITDVVMPRMSGRDLGTRVAEQYPDMKCLFMSGYTANVIAHRGVLDEGVAFLAKPFTRAELARRVRDVLDG